MAKAPKQQAAEGERIASIAAALSPAAVLLFVPQAALVDGVLHYAAQLQRGA